MGELHLDIIVDRLRRESKVRCRRSPLSVLLQVLPVWGGRLYLEFKGIARCNRKGAEHAIEDHRRASLLAYIHPPQVRVQGVTEA